MCDKLGLPFVVAHVCPFAVTSEHAPPVGFGDGGSWFLTKTKWWLSMMMGWKIMFKA